VGAVFRALDPVSRWVGHVFGQARTGSGGGLQCGTLAAVAQLVDAMASKAIVLRDVWVRVPPAASNRRSRPRGPGSAAMTRAGWRRRSACSPAAATAPA